MSPFLGFPTPRSLWAGLGRLVRHGKGLASYIYIGSFKTRTAVLSGGGQAHYIYMRCVVGDLGSFWLGLLVLVLPRLPSSFFWLGRLRDPSPRRDQLRVSTIDHRRDVRSTAGTINQRLPSLTFSAEGSSINSATRSLWSPKSPFYLFACLAILLVGTFALWFHLA
ncbi:hypothetical protein B0T26DRAFT_419580 [Lasiosphaeria miniovina]|uniref:Uncharacterized protein n=1 Tax=Lasiosphaeria miniovina TaxID=1954250 RepID=A0AA40A5I2_9PEZI|nr:uncharacterized protein B0T26DRAFT_419580 [Lasiosphaeria miniovina]KAK0709718.1 hypothetical protein B0T26DRAFT_419580 [Lasiosphaeria miniovina]